MTNDLIHGSRRPARFAWHLVCGVTCAALPVTVLGSCGGSTETVEPVTPRVKVFVVGKQATGQSRRISGKVEAADESQLSFGVSGQVAEIIVNTGQTVSEGQLLARLDSEPLQLALEKARADVATARAKLVDARSVAERLERLLESRGASQQEVDAAWAGLAQADGDLKAARATLEQAEIDLTRTRLVAPFAGQVVSIPINRFEEVQATQTAFVLQATDALEVAVRVPETLIRDVDFGQAVQATFPSLPGTTVNGVVTQIGAKAESGNAFPVTVTLLATEDDVRPGMTASITFNFSAYLGARTAYLIPLSAIAIDAELLGPVEPDEPDSDRDVPIYVYDPATRTVRARKVLVGDLRGNEIEVFEGLQPGEMVVSAGVAFVRDGMRAEVWKPRRKSS